MSANRPSRNNQRGDIADLFVTNGCEQLLECKDGEHISFCILPKPASVKEPSQDHCDAIPVLQQEFVGSHTHIKAAALGNKDLGPHWAQCRTILLKKGAAVASACVFAVATMNLHGKDFSALVVVYIATPPSFRRLGLARLLVAKLLDVQAQVAKQANLHWNDPVFYTIVANTKVAKSFWGRCGFEKPKLDRMCDYLSDGTFCFRKSFVWAYESKGALDLGTSIRNAKQKLGLIPSPSLSSNASAATPLACLLEASDCSPMLVVNGKGRACKRTSNAAHASQANMFDAIVIDNGPTTAETHAGTPAARKAIIGDSRVQHSAEATDSETETDSERTLSPEPEEGTADEKDSKAGTPDIPQPRRTARSKAGVISLPQHYVWDWDHKTNAQVNQLWNRIGNRNRLPAYFTGNLLQGAPVLRQRRAAALKAKFEDVPDTGMKHERRSSKQTTENLYLKPRTSYRNRKPAATEREQSEDEKMDEEEASDGERDTGNYLSAFKQLAELDKQAARMQGSQPQQYLHEPESNAATPWEFMEEYPIAEIRLVGEEDDKQKEMQSDYEMQFDPAGGILSTDNELMASASEVLYPTSQQAQTDQQQALPGLATTNMDEQAPYGDSAGCLQAADKQVMGQAAGLKRQWSTDRGLNSEAEDDWQIHGCKRSKLSDGQDAGHSSQEHCGVLQVSINVVQTNHAMEVDDARLVVGLAATTEEGPALVTVQLTVVDMPHSEPANQGPCEQALGHECSDQRLPTVKQAVRNGQQMQAPGKPISMQQPSAGPVSSRPSAGVGAVEEVMTFVRHCLMKEMARVPDKGARATKLLHSLRRFQAQGCSLLGGLEHMLSSPVATQPNVTVKQQPNGLQAAPSTTQRRLQGMKSETCKAAAAKGLNKVNKGTHAYTTQQQRPESSRKLGKSSAPAAQPAMQESKHKCTILSSKRPNQQGTQDTRKCGQSASAHKRPAAGPPTISEEGLQKHAHQLLSRSPALMPLVQDLLQKHHAGSSKLLVDSVPTEPQPEASITPSAEQLGLNDASIRQLLSRVAPILRGCRQPTPKS